MARAYHAGGLCWRADFLVVITSGVLNVELVNLIVVGVFGGLRACGDTILGFDVLLCITLECDAL